ncbi:ATP-binding protein [Streptomyces sp. NPDC058398]|uniref:ATP-binding protein n=1 Tax=Streptomyces sp. NPDC058398 TaxID=3346479 RepID=UPI00365FDA83
MTDPPMNTAGSAVSPHLATRISRYIFRPKHRLPRPAPPQYAQRPEPSRDLGSGRSSVAEAVPNRPSLVRDLMLVTFTIASGGMGGTVCEHDAQRVRAVRRLTTAHLKYQALEELVDDAIVVVSELVTNAIKHSGGTQVTVTMVIGDQQLQLFVHAAVQDGGPQLRSASEDSESGRGLFLVDRIARTRSGRWGIGDAGATTWCSFSLDGEQS